MRGEVETTYCRGLSPCLSPHLTPCLRMGIRIVPHSVRKVPVCPYTQGTECHTMLSRMRKHAVAVRWRCGAVVVRCGGGDGAVTVTLAVRFLGMRIHQSLREFNRDFLCPLCLSHFKLSFVYNFGFI